MDEPGIARILMCRKASSRPFRPTPISRDRSGTSNPVSSMYVTFDWDREFLHTSTGPRHGSGDRRQGKVDQSPSTALCVQNFSLRLGVWFFFSAPSTSQMESSYHTSDIAQTVIGGLSLGGQLNNKFQPLGVCIRSLPRRLRWNVRMPGSDPREDGSEPHQSHISG